MARAYSDIHRAYIALTSSLPYRDMTVTDIATVICSLKSINGDLKMTSWLGRVWLHPCRAGKLISSHTTVGLVPKLVEVVPHLAPVKMADYSTLLPRPGKS